ncbi:hypothetical protein AC622_20330 [Bacillus sp. FJAT-27916]|uniref:DUF3021 family protein n=1 Tax=Bacillus sp. FJAT-27916 TaxID=1679169 RepID=UPI0006710CA8|nr:DUF3021 family protein [Bacillus sp. FJAT-27916]KMY46245.1 hypothetical protein AC622_20330 [Bacillus sp. FJAT-27916]
MQLLLNGLYRGSIPLGILLIISLSYKLQGQSDDSSAYFFYGLIAFFLGLASVIYQIKQWSFLKQIFAHYMAMLITVFPTLLLSGFYPLDSFKDVFDVYLQFNKVGIILFLTIYFIEYVISRRNSSNSTSI